MRMQTLLCLLALLGICGCSAGTESPHSGERITELVAGDTLLVTDQVGSLLGEANPWGKRLSTVALTPYGFARRDDSSETNKHAGTPRDGAVGLDHMGARFYAPDLGVWASPDPVSLSEPELQVAADFAAAHSYAYANLRPVVTADRDGRFGRVAAGAAVGAVCGFGAEAVYQIVSRGRIEDWGRVGAATAAGALAGGAVAAMPVAGLVATVGMHGAANVAAGVTQRLIESGGQSAGTLTQVAVDGGVGMAGGAFAKAAGPFVGYLASKFRTPVPVGVVGGQADGGGLGRTISEGHAFAKHVVKKGEFRDLGIDTPEAFARHIDGVVSRAEGANVRQLQRGRSAYWDEGTGTLVVRNPGAADMGTAYRPPDGRKHFESLR